MVKPNRTGKRPGYGGPKGIKRMVRRVEQQFEERGAEYAGRHPRELGPQYLSDGTPYQTAKEARQLAEAQQKILRQRAGPNKEVSSMVMAGKPAYKEPPRYSNMPDSLVRTIKRPVNKSTSKEGRKRKPPTRIAKTASRQRYGY
jgi:hypothetical protein